MMVLVRSVDVRMLLRVTMMWLPDAMMALVYSQDVPIQRH
jgi:hypothetical protein